MRFVVADTGHEHPDTLGHLQLLAVKLGQPIETVRGPYTFLELAKKKRVFPSTKSRFCTTELKVKPMAEYVHGLQDSGEEVVVALGIRADESPSRSRMREWEPTSEAYDSPLWRPILRWTSEDVFECHRRHDMPPNPLYLRGQGRVGCWPCIMATKENLRAAFSDDPDLLGRLQEYEQEVAEVSPRGSATFFAPGKVPPSMRRTIVDAKGNEQTIATVEDVWRWATDPDQPTLEFGDPPTCMSQYGLCE
jgi:3'-phosphoadenosine 5'-phosphosulfate sulfotransferase (PAPS reductase)/FAD synthetase